MMFWQSHLVVILITILVIKLPQAASRNGQKERVLSLQKSGSPSAGSFARLQVPFPAMYDFTVCYRVRLNRFREESTLMSYAISDSKDNELRMDHRDTGFKVSIHSTWAKTDIRAQLSIWTHYCITYVKLTGGYEIYENGQLTAQGTLSVYDGPLEGNGAYVIGQEQDSFGGDFQRDQSFCGEITELNFWTTKLTGDAVKQVSGCDAITEGDGLAWSQMQWNISGETEWVQYDREAFCVQSLRKFVIFPTRTNLKYSLKMCQDVGGRLAVPQSAEENEWLYNKSEEFAAYCSSNFGGGYMWLGATDEEAEGVWRYIETSLPIKWEGPWKGGNPNGGTAESCVVMLSGQVGGKWSDIDCLETYFFCVPCEFETRAYLYLKGPAMCTTSPFNYEYFFEGEKGGKPQIVGTYHSEIYWENTTQSWVLRSLKDKHAVIRFTPAYGLVYPFGKRTWVVENEICGLSRGQSVNMTFSACGGGLFTCQDGSCIDLQQRCDLRLDCPDHSDEADCTLVDVPDGYKDTIPPPPTHPPDPLNITFLVNIISFPAIKTEDLTFQANLLIYLLWKDSRLKFQNLKRQKSLNALSSAEVKRIWTPKVFFSNAFGNTFTNLDEGSRVDCQPEGNSEPGSRSDTEERNIFSGLKTNLDMGQYYSATYSCDFDLLMFPFDAQSCAMKFTLISASAEYMILFPGQTQYSGSLSINETKENSFSSINITVRFLRRFAFYLLTLYIPSFLLVVIAYTTLFFSPGDFNSRIVVALTALLVLSSLFSQTSNSLPKTSYFKLIDVWLFFSTLIIFFIVLFHTIGEYFSYEIPSKKKASPRILQGFSVGQKSKFKMPPNWINGNDQKYLCGFSLDIFAIYCGRIFIPLLYLVFNLCYWGTTLRHLNQFVWPLEDSA